jgi:DNA-binding response OmpR family regulator
MGKKILIVDDDPSIRRLVATMLAAEGYSIEHAVNGEEGFDIARSWTPDLVITDILMDQMDGWTLVKRLRSHPRLAMVPVILLTALDSEEDRIRGYRLGADDYLPKPFHLEELKARITATFDAMLRMRTHAQQLAGHEDTNATLKGQLEHLGVSSLLTVLEMERKSGVLVLRGADGEGRAFLRKGSVLAAMTEQNSGADAIYELLGWTNGTFSFSAIDVDMDDTIEQSTMNLLLEGARRLDEQAEAARRER